MKRAMQSAARRYTSQSPGRACPRTSLRIAWLVMPNARPLAIEYVSGMMITVRKAGMAMPGSAQSISASAPIISAPTRISAGAVAAVGMILVGALMMGALAEIDWADPGMADRKSTRLNSSHLGI